MAVAAADLAPRDLRFEPRARGTPGDERADERDLVGDVVEVQDLLIGFAAVHARMTREVLPHERACRPHTFATGLGALAAVLVATQAEVLAEAVATPVLQTVAPAVERRARELLTAAGASSGALVDHERMFAFGTDGTAGLS